MHLAQSTQPIYFKEKGMKRYGLFRKYIYDNNGWGLSIKGKPVNPYFPGK